MTEIACMLGIAAALLIFTAIGVIGVKYTIDSIRERRKNRKEEVIKEDEGDS